MKLRDDQRIWVRPLPGLGDPEGKGRVLRLLSHLYGHPLANAAFQERWVELMVEFGMHVVDGHNGTGFSYEAADVKLLVARVVDDSVVAYSSDAILEKLVTFLESKLPITVTPLEHVCGLRVTRNPDGSTCVDQAEYIEKKAKAFGCDGPGRFFKTPMAPGFKPGPRPEIADSSKVTLARELMGSLIQLCYTHSARMQICLLETFVGCH